MPSRKRMKRNPNDEWLGRTTDFGQANRGVDSPQHLLVVGPQDIVEDTRELLAGEIHLA